MIDEIGNKSLIENRQWSRLPVFTDEEKKALLGSSDFLALNYYTSRLIAPKTSESFGPSFENDVGVDYFIEDTWPQAKSSWLYSVPKGLEDILKWIKEKYDNPIVIISENGVSDEGQLDDASRIQYFNAHIGSVANALKDGSNIIGYTVWSIIDNFEWTSGYTEHFGIFSVNMTSDKKERTAKSSAEFIKKLISSKTIFY